MAEPKTEELMKRGSAELAVPDFLRNENDASGTEHLSQDDVTIPRLALAQKMSPQVDETQQEYIDGLKPGMFFNTLTGEIYGKVVKAAIIRMDPPRYIEFDASRKVVDLNVPANDPRTQFGAKDPKTGKPSKPVATKFYNYIGVLMPFNMEEPMQSALSISLKGKSIPTAKDLNGFVMMRKPKPLYAGVYTFTPALEENEHGPFYVFKVKNSGWCTAEEFPILKMLSEAVKNAPITIDVDKTDIDDSIAANPEQSGGSTEFGPDM